MPRRWKFNTHTDLIAAGQAGKTAERIYEGRIHILAKNQIVRQAWKADMYEADVAFVAHAKPSYKVVLLNPSGGNVPWNPFKLYGELSTHAENLSKAIVENVSGDRNREVPTYSETAEPFFAYLALTGETPFTALRFFENPKEWARASDKVPEPYASTFRRIGALKGKEFTDQTGTLRRRLRPFINSTALRKFTSSPKGVSIHQLLKDGYSIFFNGAPSGLLSLESARVINGLFLAELMRFGIENATTRRSIFCDGDEIQEYAPADFSSTIDLVLGAGLKFTLVHHHAEQFPERLRMSVETNARIKIIGGGISPDVRKHYAEIAWPDDINSDVIKQERLRSITKYYEDESLSIHTDPDGNVSETLSPRLHPESHDVSAGFEYYGLEEKRSKAAQRLIVPNRTFTAILPDGTVEKFTVPPLRRYLYNSETCLKFIETSPFAVHELPERINHASPRTRKKSPGLFHAE